MRNTLIRRSSNYTTPHSDARPAIPAPNIKRLVLKKQPFERDTFNVSVGNSDPSSILAHSKVENNSIIVGDQYDPMKAT